MQKVEKYPIFKMFFFLFSFCTEGHFFAKIGAFFVSRGFGNPAVSAAAISTQKLVLGGWDVLHAI